MGTDGGPSAFYDAAEWYDFIHLPETEAELPAVMSIFGALGNGGKRVLEPACGTGRYLAALSDRGYECLGYDLNENALAFARRRGCRVLRADMARFSSRERFDLAFCPIGSFRHLLSGASAVSHFKKTARLLAPGGLYVVGLDLCDYESVIDDEEVWRVEEGRKSAWHAMTAFAPDRRRRRERVLNFVSWQDGARQGTFSSAYDLRSYDWPQWESALKKSKLALLGWYDQEGRKQRAKRPGYWLFALAKT